MNKYNYLINHALDIAERYILKTGPNPKVGAILLKNGVIVARGYHRGPGTEHAEAECLSKVQNAEGAELVLNLEPCDHHGNTPPCSKLIISRGIKRVVFATFDPDPRVSGRGYYRLVSAGVDVISGINQVRSISINRPYFFAKLKKRPLITVHIATTLDGASSFHDSFNFWHSSELAWRDLQKWRATSDGIMVGIGTVIKDNPSLSVRYPEYKTDTRKIVLDTLLKIPDNSTLLKDPSDKLIIVHTEDAPIERQKYLKDLGCTLIQCKKNGRKIDLFDLVSRLYDIGIYNLFVEGGRRIISNLLKHHLIDRILLYRSSILVEGGMVPFKFIDYKNISIDGNFALIQLVDLKDTVCSVYIHKRADEESILELLNSSIQKKIKI